MPYTCILLKKKIITVKEYFTLVSFHLVILYIIALFNKTLTIVKNDLKNTTSVLHYKPTRLFKSFTTILLLKENNFGSYQDMLVLLRSYVSYMLHCMPCF